MISGQKAILPADSQPVSLYQLIDYDQTVVTSPERSQQVLIHIGQQIAETISEKF